LTGTDIRAITEESAPEISALSPVLRLTPSRDFVRTRLASYLYPRLIEFVRDLPVATTGKVRRSALREREAHRGWTDRRARLTARSPS
jgi:acyl-CoA synthetase (AMP-forming)/AMP-acid ligase II